MAGKKTKNSVLNRELLYYLGAKNASFRPLNITTGKIAEETGRSQQTISRQLIELEKEGLIIRNSSPEGVSILLTKKAIQKMKEDYVLLRNIFETKKELKGKVETGLGEGKYYMSQQEYQNQFREKLGFFAWPGTLNLRVEPEEARRFLISESPVYIEGFETPERSFGGLWCYPVKLFGERAAIVIPERTT
ncbi:DUF120 domain-containing protein, partial [Candidatus Woesearchaeota archaeon]